MTVPRHESFAIRFGRELTVLAPLLATWLVLWWLVSRLDPVLRMGVWPRPG